MDPIREAVRQKYAQSALQMSDGSGCCDSGCCGTGAAGSAIGQGEYQASDVADLGLSLGVSLGCGNPTALAQLHPGEIVLDLGSGAGLDVLLSARRVSPGGHAYGVDMTDEMLVLANEHKTKAGVANATFLKGTIDAIPLPDQSVDVVISNCVINLATDKDAVLAEAFRLLKPGGQLLFLGHVRADEPRLARWQDRLHGLQVRFGHGCHCNRRALESIEGAGFQVAELAHDRLRKAPARTAPDGRRGRAAATLTQ